jgi:antirestriction protein ArdC
MSRFHKYSMNNQILIYMQKPDATLVAGYNKWKNQFKRNVLKGEKGIKIIAPTPFKKRIEQEKRDPDTDLPLLDADGKVIIEEKEIKIPMFKPVTVFDVSQTDGKPLPQLASDLSGNVQNYEVFMEALRRASPAPIDFKPIADNADGFFSPDNQRITIREGMSEIQTVSAVVHEIAHAKLHNNKKVEEPKNAPTFQEVEIFDVPGLFSNGRIADADIPEGLFRCDLRGSDDDPGMPIAVEERVVVNHAGSILTAKPLDLTEEGRLMFTEDDGINFAGGHISASRFLKEQQKDRNTEEVEAESISFAVCAYYGIATGENSFGYIATWSKDKDLKELRDSLETINKASSELITDIDRNYAEIVKERESEVIAAPEAATETEHEEVSDNISTVGKEYTGEGPLKDAVSGFIDEIARKVQEEVPVQAPDNGYMPDPSMSIETMNAYGYTDENMLPLSKERALELMERDVTVYMLYNDNSEAMAFEPEDIQMFSGMFGVKRTDWEQVRGEFPPMDTELVRRKQEQAFQNSPVDSKELPFFDNSNYLKSAEMQMEDDYGMIDGIINNGAKQPEKPEKKPPVKQLDERSNRPSVLEKLRKYQTEDKMITAKHRSAERDEI